MCFSDDLKLCLKKKTIFKNVYSLFWNNECFSIQESLLYCVCTYTLLLLLYRLWLMKTVKTALTGVVVGYIMFSGPNRWKTVIGMRPSDNRETHVFSTAAKRCHILSHKIYFIYYYYYTLLLSRDLRSVRCMH